MIRAVSCPHCDEPFHVAPFQGSVLIACPWCDATMVVTQSGMDWEGSDLTTTRAINGAWALAFHRDPPPRWVLVLGAGRSVG